MVKAHVWLLVAVTLCGIAAVAGCGTTSTPEGDAPGGDGGGGSGGAAPAGGEGVFGVADASATPHAPSASSAADAGFCGGGGPVVVVGDSHGGSVSACTGQIAEATFKSALCTCHDVNLQGYLRTRGFDSSKGPYDPSAPSAQTGAPVGINHDYVIPSLGANAGFTDVGGSFSIAGTESVAFAGALSVDGDFRAAGSLDLKGYTRVGRHAYVGASVTNAGFATVAGDLHITGTDMLPLVVRGARTREAVAVASPCACDNLLDVAALVDHARGQNDNAKIGLGIGDFENVVGSVERHLPCGIYYVRSISGLGNIVVHVDGRVALFVEERVAAVGNLEVTLAPGAEIDVFVKGSLALVGRGAFGSPQRPAATRIYVGGSDDIPLVGASGFVGNLYAPRARVTATGYASISGSVFARDFIAPGFADFVYDRAITHAGDGCNAPPPATCETCGVCPHGNACVNGTCGPCRTDGDCCGQDVCVAGVCQVLIK